MKTSLNFGLISNGRICALVSEKGSLDFLCMPNFDSAFVFDKLLAPSDGGFFSIEPASLESYTIYQWYEKNSNVLLTHFLSEHAGFVIHDFMPRWDIWDGNRSHTPPELCRYIEVEFGEPEIIVNFNPKAGYTKEYSECSILNPTTIQCTHAEGPLYLVSSFSPNDILGKSTIRLKSDGFFTLSSDSPSNDASILAVKEKLLRTNQYWQRWVKNCYLPEDYQKEIIRSALVLKQLIYEPTGAIIAAPTTSLPEIYGGIRNWDYRYCWIRDSFFTVNALLKLSKFEETEQYIAYLALLNSRV